MSSLTVCGAVVSLFNICFFNITVESAYSIIVTWEAIHPKSGLDVTYLLFKGKSQSPSFQHAHSSQVQNDNGTLEIQGNETCSKLVMIDSSMETWYQKYKA